jgi:LysM repeat protein
MRINVTALALALCALALAAFAADTFYTVRKGDTLSEIAGQHKVTVGALKAANALKDADELDIGQKLRIPGSGPSATSPATRGGRYTVKAGDTLSEIAARLGTSSEALARANGIADPRELQVGQVLSLPATPKDSASVAASATPLPASLKRQLDAQKVTAGKWRHIVIHHSATSVGSARSMELYHRNTRRMENGLAYHFVIGNGRGMGDGEIAIGSRWRRQIKGGHLASTALNDVSIGICLVGNYQLTRPTSRQLSSLYALVNYLEDRCRTPADAVKTHRQINTRPTDCPGRLFPTQALLDNT